MRRTCAATLAALPDVLDVDAHGNEVVISSENGSAAVSDVVVALRDAGAEVKELTLRSPTLDDVFLELTGARMAADEERQREREEVPA